MPHKILDGREQGLATIADMEAAMSAGRVHGYRRQVAPAAFGVPAPPLIVGTEIFASDALAAWHRGPQEGQLRDVACYVLSDMVVAGTGQVWVDGHVVTSPEIMPPYVAGALEIAAGGVPELHYCLSLPKRTIEAPCLVAIGAWAETYGHFLIEMLFRILVARRAFPAKERVPYKLLLDAATPGWLLRILANDLGIDQEDIELFQPWQEQILLRQAILPSRVFQDHMIHPIADRLIDDLVEGLRLPARADLPRRIFVARGLYHTPAGSRRACINEQDLIKLAVERHGFVSVHPETMSWREQIALFQHAIVAVGLAGSGLHNALFCRSGSRIGSIGLMNFIQSEIGALRGQHNGYLTKDVEMNGEFLVDLATFEAFVRAICS